MTAAFAPIPALPTTIPDIFQSIPVPTGPAATPRMRNRVDVGIDWDTPQGAALQALLLRAAYMDDEVWLSRVSRFVPGCTGFKVLDLGELGDWNPVFLDCGTYRIFVMHGVKDSSQYRAVVLDLLIPRYSAGAHQFLASVSPIGDFISTWFAANEPDSPPLLMCAHSFGGVIASYWQGKVPDNPTVGRATYFGVPKLGPVPARDVLIGVPLAFWATREDPVIGLPPSFIRLPDVPFLTALFPIQFPGQAVARIKRHIDGVWNTLQSAAPDAECLNPGGTVGTLTNIDDGRNWYARTGIGVTSVLNFSSEVNIESHKIATYYNRLRALFSHWTNLPAAAGPGGREVDVVALALTVAELGE